MASFVAGYRLVLVAVVVVGLALLGGWPGTLVYFTVQSNILLALVTLAAVLRRSWWDTPAGAVARGAVTLWICITGLVFHLLLAGTEGGDFTMTGGDAATDGASVAAEVSNQLLHTVTPIMALIGWLVFGSAQRRVRWRWAVLWLVYPLAYLVFALVRGAATGEYPYPFLDVAELGTGGVARWCVLLLFCFLALGLAVIGAGRLGARVRSADGVAGVPE